MKLKQRELLFRAWDKKEKELFSSPVEIEYLCSWFDAHLPGPLANPDNKIITQYIGFCDCNGFKVFEGDIVDYEYWIQTSSDPDSTHAAYKGEGVIEFIEGAFMIKNIESKHTVPLHYDDLSFKIVENIFQNPKFMGVEK